MSRYYEEIVVYAGIGERTGNRLHRAPGNARVSCTSLSQLGAAVRRRGDGLYYLADIAWPPDTETVDFNRPWVPFR